MYDCPCSPRAACSQGLNPHQHGHTPRPALRQRRWRDRRRPATGTADQPPRQPPLGTPRRNPRTRRVHPRGLCREVREETGLSVRPVSLTGVYKNMNRRHHRPGLPLPSPRRQLPPTTRYAIRWATREEIASMADEAFAIRVLDALNAKTKQQNPPSVSTTEPTSSDNNQNINAPPPIAMTPWVTSLITLAAVAIGALLSFVSTRLTDRSRWHRERKSSLGRQASR